MRKKGGNEEKEERALKFLALDPPLVLSMSQALNRGVTVAQLQTVSSSAAIPCLIRHLFAAEKGSSDNNACLQLYSSSSRNAIHRKRK